MTPRRGMTLVELLVCLFVFALFTTMVATATVTAYRNYHLSDDKLVFLRSATNAVNRIEGLPDLAL